MDVQSLLAGLSGAMGRRGNSRGGAAAPRTAPYADLSGNDLQQAGIDELNAAMPDEIEQRRQIQRAVGDPHADFNAANDAIMGSTDRNPGWSGFFGLMRGKKVRGDVGGTESVGRMRTAPGTDNVLEQSGVDWPVESDMGRALIGLQQAMRSRGR